MSTDDSPQDVPSTCVTVSGSGEDTWHTRGYDNRNSAWNPAASGVQEEPHEAWSVNVGAVPSGSPIVGNGMVFIASSDPEQWGHSPAGTTGYVTALDRSDGTTIWEYDLQAGVESTPAFRNGIVYIVDKRGRVHAIDNETGEQVWVQSIGLWYPDTDDTWNMNREYQARFYNGITIARGLLYVYTPAGSLVGIDPSAGDIDWEQTLGTGGMAAPAVDDTGVYVVQWPLAREVQAVKAYNHDGSGRFQSKARREFSDISLGSDYIFAGGGRFLHSLNKNQGITRWKQSFHDGFHHSGVVTDTTVFSTTYESLNPETNDAGIAGAIDTESGAVQWEVTSLSTDQFFSGNVYQPAMGGKTLYLGGGQGANLYAIDAECGSILWSHTLKGANISFTSTYQPAVVGSSIYVASVGERTTGGTETETVGRVKCIR